MAQTGRVRHLPKSALALLQHFSLIIGPFRCEGNPFQPFPFHFRGTGASKSLPDSDLPSGANRHPSNTPLISPVSPISPICPAVGGHGQARRHAEHAWPEDSHHAGWHWPPWATLGMVLPPPWDPQAGGCRTSPSPTSRAAVLFNHTTFANFAKKLPRGSGHF